jgi:outer membrane protein assembly factor BamB
VAVGGRDWNVYTVDKASGQQILVYGLGFSPTEATPAIIGDTVYIGASDRSLRALDGRTTIGWWDETWRTIRSQLFEWGVLGVPPESKGLIWKFEAGLRRDNRITVVLAVSDSTIYLGAWDNRLYAVDRANGAERWHFQADSPIQGGPALAGDIVYFASYDGTVYALDAQSGEKRWSLALPTRITSTPAVGNGLLFITGVNGVLYAIG